MIAVIQSRKAAKRRRKISVAQNRLHARIEQRFNKAYRSWLFGVRKDILTRLDQFGTTQVTAADLFNPRDHGRRFSGKILPQWTFATWSGVKFEADWIGSQEASQSLMAAAYRQDLEFDPDDIEMPPSIEVSPSPGLMRSVREFIRERQVGVWSKITKTTHDTLNREIRKGLAEGDNLDDLSRRIRGTLTNYSDYQAKRVARTETTASMNHGGQAERTEIGISFKEWISVLDARNRGADATSPFDHLTPDGQIVANERPFIVSGQQLMYPGDSSMGASAGNVIQCRCTSVASFDGPRKSTPLPTPQPKPKPPKLPTEKAPKPKPVAPKPKPPKPTRLDKKPAHLTYSGKEPSEFAEKVWEEVGAAGITSEEHSRRVGKIVRDQVEKHPVLAKATDALAKAKAEHAAAKAEAARLLDLLKKASDEEAGKLYVKWDAADVKAARLDDAVFDAGRAVQQARPIAARETLAEVRDMGYSLDEFRKAASPTMRGRTVGPTKEAMESLPADWAKSIEEWAATGDPVVFDRIKRGFFDQIERKVRISGANAEELASTALHELAHAAEQNHAGGKLAQLQREFLTRRAAGERLTEITKGEFGFKDGFLSHYSGRIYPGSNKHYEILSTGIESVFYHTPTRDYWTDADYMDFILGLLAGM